MIDVSSVLCFCIRHDLQITLFPYTTLFRSNERSRGAVCIDSRCCGVLDGTGSSNGVCGTFVQRLDVKNDCVGTRTRDRKSTRLNSSHTVTSYAVFCLKKKNLLINSAR